MKRSRMTYVKNIVLPCVIFSMMTGVVTCGLIFGYKVLASEIMELSRNIYAHVRANPGFLPLLLLGAALLGLLATLLLRWEPACRGGGIPTAIAQLRGLLNFRWLRSLVLVLLSSLVTFFCGVPLGNEGPSVQMGTAVGRGAVRLFGRNNPAWDRYVMTGGACAGFAAATGAPLTGILFAFEEAHRRFSPMIFMASASTVIFGTATADVLCDAFGVGRRLFDFQIDAVLPTKSLWSVVIVGLVCGVVAAGFTKLYRTVRSLVHRVGRRVPFAVLSVSLFLLVAAVGFFFQEVLGSGHEIVDVLLEGHGVWYLLLIWFVLRALFLIFANNVGVTGGLFVPSLAFGAILGFLCAKTLVAVGALGEEYTVILTAVGMASFLGASSRIPLTAVTFSLEALSGLSNVLPFALGVTLSYLVVEVSGIAGFNETVTESLVEKSRVGKVSQTVSADVTVRPGAFVVGKEIRNILWPPSCVILSVSRNAQKKDLPSGGMEEGDVLHVHFTSCNPRETMENLEALVGKQALEK